MPILIFLRFFFGFKLRARTGETDKSTRYIMRPIGRPHNKYVQISLLANGGLTFSLQYVSKISEDNKSSTCVVVLVQSAWSATADFNVI